MVLLRRTTNKIRDAMQGCMSRAMDVGIDFTDVLCARGAAGAAVNLASHDVE